MFIGLNPFICKAFTIVKGSEVKLRYLRNKQIDILTFKQHTMQFKSTNKGEKRNSTYFLCSCKVLEGNREVRGLGAGLYNLWGVVMPVGQSLDES